jgi:hypothetical protein
MKPSLRAFSTVLIGAALLSTTPLLGQGGSDALIVSCARPCSAVRAVVANAGGVVTREYDNIDALAVQLPSSATAALLSAAGPQAVHKDVMVNAPRPAASVELQSGVVAGPQGAIDSGFDPGNYNYNLAVNNVASLHAAGQVGQDVVVGLIDSGSANVAAISALAGSIIGGETFVPPAIDPLSATHRQNGSHGTMTAEMIAAHGGFAFYNTSALVQAVNAYMPGSAVPCLATPNNCNLDPATAAIASRIPMTGTAPGARIYALKVFPAAGGGAPGRGLSPRWTAPSRCAATTTPRESTPSSRGTAVKRIPSSTAR